MPAPQTSLVIRWIIRWSEQVIPGKIERQIKVPTAAQCTAGDYLLQPPYACWAHYVTHCDDLVVAIWFGYIYSSNTYLVVEYP